MRIRAALLLVGVMESRVFILLFAVTTVGTLMSPASAAVPYDLTNVHSRNSCPRQVLVVRPNSIADVEMAVMSYANIMPTGAGRSWNHDMFCSSQSNFYSLSANILTTTIRPLRVEVDEDEQTVTVSAGVIVIDLLDYLANFITPAAPAGWTLGAFPWYVYQTIGGAVATGTHGSSLQHNSLSHQVDALHVVLANGTSTWISNESHPFLMKAFRVSVGRIGIITELKMRIQPEVPVKRTNVWMLPSAFVAKMQEIEDLYNSEGRMPEWADETQFFWSAQTQEVSQVTFRRADKGSVDARKSILAGVQPDDSTLELLWAITSEILDLRRERSSPLMPSNVLQRQRISSVQSSDSSSSAPPSAPTADEFAVDYFTYLDTSSGSGSQLQSTMESLEQQEDAVYFSTSEPESRGIGQSMSWDGSSDNPTRQGSEESSEEGIARNGGSGEAQRVKADAAAEQARSAVNGGGSSLLGNTATSQSAMSYDDDFVVDADLIANVLSRLDISLFQRTDMLDNLTAQINALDLGPQIMASLGPFATTWQPVEPVPRRGWIATPGASYLYAAGVVSGLEAVVGNATFEAASSYIHQPLETNQVIETTLYSQYEVAVPVSTAGACFEGLMKRIYGENIDTAFGWTDNDTGFRTANLIRIIGKEDGFLALSNDEPRVYMNFEDYVGPNMEPGTGFNEGFQSVVAFFRGSEECRGTRMHWGKSGLPEEGCFNGAEEFPDTWCHFGCAVRDLDPSGKFTDTSMAWNWQGVDLDSCCTPDGFDYARCQCNPTPIRDNCPPSPFYDVESKYMYWE